MFNYYFYGMFYNDLECIDLVFYKDVMLYLIGCDGFWVYILKEYVVFFSGCEKGVFNGWEG